MSSTTSVPARAFESGMFAFLADLLTGRNPRMRRNLVSWGCFQENEAELVTDLKKECQDIGWCSQDFQDGWLFAENSKCHCV